MIFIKLDNSYVTYIHYMPFHEKHGFKKTREQLEQEGILVNEVPEPEQIEGKAAILHANPETKELWYEYEDIQPTPGELEEQRITQLENQSQMQQALLDDLLLNVIPMLMMGGGM